MPFTKTATTKTANVVNECDTFKSVKLPCLLFHKIIVRIYCLGKGGIMGEGRGLLERRLKRGLRGERRSIGAFTVWSF